jgi:purine-binding chemotaxis protein CheW
MNTATGPRGSLLLELRSGFDASFAAPPPVRETPESVLQIRVGGERFAVRPEHTGGLAKVRKVVPMPGRLPELMGLVALRGAILPVFDLAALLGIAPDATPPEWMILAAGDTAAALAFHAFEGQGAPEWLGEHADADGKSVQLVRTGTVICALLDLPRLFASVQSRAGTSKSIKEKK